MTRLIAARRSHLLQPGEARALADAACYCVAVTLLGPYADIRRLHPTLGGPPASVVPVFSNGGQDGVPITRMHEITLIEVSGGLFTPIEHIQRRVCRKMRVGVRASRRNGPARRRRRATAPWEASLCAQARLRARCAWSLRDRQLPLNPNKEERSSRPQETQGASRGCGQGRVPHHHSEADRPGEQKALPRIQGWLAPSRPRILHESCLRASSGVMRAVRGAAKSCPRPSSARAAPAPHEDDA